MLWVMTACLLNGNEGESGADRGTSGPGPRCDEDDRLPAGGVGKAFGARTWWFSWCFCALGDSLVGVTWPERTCVEPEARGVLDDSCPASCESAVPGVPQAPTVRGVPRPIVGRRCNPDGPGITISERGCGPADASMEPRALLLVRLSLRRSRSVFSPRTAGLLVKPPELAEDAPDSGG